MSKQPDVAAINQALKNATELLAFDLRLTGQTYDLKLTVGRSGSPAATLLCRDVQNLELNPTGDGFDQLLHLHVEDLRDDHLDRIHFSLEELERETLFLHCAAIELVQTPD
jgi:hypothetical protein